MAAKEVPAIQVTLRCTDKLDEYDTRTLTLRPGAVIQIGRASKNSAKPELMIGPGNAYIDSPTISREHAVLTATSPPAPCVYITDKGSMHGTMVNGNKLEPQKAHRLSNGDELQFGANVARENLFYTSRSFTFQSSLPSYPKGFSVPDDVETSDEEDVEVDEGLSCSPHYGTQAYPVTLDEGNVSKSQKAQVELIEDEEFPDEVDLELADTTHSVLDASEDTADRSPPAYVEKAIHHPVNAIEEISSDDDEPVSDYSSEDDHAPHIDSCASLGDSDESQSDGDMELNDDEEVDELADDAAARLPAPMPALLPAPTAVEDHPPPVPTLSTQETLTLLCSENKKRLLMTRQEQDMMARQAQDSARYAHMPREHHAAGMPIQTDSRDHDGNPELPPTVPLAPFASMGRSPAGNGPKGQTPLLFHHSGHNGFKTEPQKVPEQPESHMGPYFNHNAMLDEMYFGHMDAAIPPRPAASRPVQWNVLDYGSPFSPPVQGPVFACGYSPDMLGGCPTPSEPLLPNMYVAQEHPAPSDNTWIPPKDSTAGPVSGVQTPPSARTTFSEGSSPPVRRTEVFTIDEIVEKTTEQPLTPTSVTAGVKRKADALDEPVEEAVQDIVGEDNQGAPPTPELDAEAVVAVQDPSPGQASATAASSIEQRPKKKLRSRLGDAARTAVAWTLPGVFVGAAASVAFLTSVPNDFYVA